MEILGLLFLIFGGMTLTLHQAINNVKCNLINVLLIYIAIFLLINGGIKIGRSVEKIKCKCSTEKVLNKTGK